MPGWEEPPHIPGAIRTPGSWPASASDLLGLLEQVIAPSTPHILRSNFIYSFPGEDKNPWTRGGVVFLELYF